MHRRLTMALERHKSIVLIALVGALLLAGWWLARERDPAAANHHEQSPIASEHSRDQAAPSQRERDPKVSSDSRAREPASRERATFDRAKRDALRREILQAQAERSPRPVAQPSEDEPRPVGQLTDRIGGREALLEHLNHDFMPLADECIEQARARHPTLEGMLAIGLDTVADPEFGGIVEAVTIPAENEVDDAELLECLSETALSMILPPPPERAREQFMLTIPVEPSPASE